jgi:NAD(P)-dependent dehydrogenase (short-subunit alcohol dehydrogenase family)
MQLNNRVAVVTGGGSGIGAAAAHRLAAAGARVGVLARTDDEVNQVVNAIQDKGGQALPLVADITSVEQMQAAYQRVIDAWGRLDVVFANAGVNGTWAPLEDLTPEEWDQTIKINLTGTFYTVKYALPYLKQRGGSVIVTSSVNGTRMFSNTGATAYASTKAAQVAFTKMIALELAQYHIRVNVICPGAIGTPIHENTEKKNLEKVQPAVEYPEGVVPLMDGDMGSAEQVADLVLFLASDASSLISGTEIWIDGAQSLLQG